MLKLLNKKLLISGILPILLLAGLYVMASRRPQRLPMEHMVNAPIAVSSDGRFIATICGPDVNKISVYDRHTGQTKRLQEQVVIGSIFFTQDGTLVTGGHTSMHSQFDGVGSVQLWNPETGASLRTMVRNQVHGDAVALSRDEQVLATGGVDYNVMLWDFKTGKLIHKFPNSGNPTTIIFAPNGEHLYISNMNAGTMAYDLKTRKKLWQTSNTWKGVAATVLSASLSPDGRILALGSLSGAIGLLDAQTGKIIRILTTLTQSNIMSSAPDVTRYVNFSPDGQLLASGSWQGVAIWDVNNGSQRSVLEGIGGVTFSPDGKELFTGSPMNSPKAVTVWKNF